MKKQRRGSKRSYIAEETAEDKIEEAPASASAFAFENDGGVITAELVWTEQEEEEEQPLKEEQSLPKKWYFFQRSSQRKNGNTGPLFPRSSLGLIVRFIKILLSLLNVIVIRGSVLTRRKLSGKLEEYQQSPNAEEEIVSLYLEHLAHHLFVFYLSWGRLIICLLVLMWGTCDDRLPHHWAIYIGMLMHWIDSIRALDSSNWLPVSDADEISKANRESTAEEEVQTAMAWLHLFWFIIDGVYCRQILQRRKREEQQKEQRHRTKNQ
jgi:hypothetical protein